MLHHSNVRRHINRTEAHWKSPRRGSEYGEKAGKMKKPKYREVLFVQNFGGVDEQVGGASTNEEKSRVLRSK
jgi:hypothetical protein